MSQKFQAVVHHREDITFVKLAGVIDEDNELAELSDKIPKGTAIIDLGDVERINSCGVRDWVNWLGNLEVAKTGVVLVECSPAIVAQINLVNNFTGPGAVKSFYVPYFCPECDEEKVLLVDTADMGPPPHDPPICRCDECDLVMDFDDMPESYFAFLANQKKLSDTSLFDAVISEFTLEETDGSKIRSRVGSTKLSGPGVSSLPSVPSLPSPRGTPAGSSLNPVSVTGTGTSNPGSLGRNPGSFGSNPGSITSNPGSNFTNPGLSGSFSRAALTTGTGPGGDVTGDVNTGGIPERAAVEQPRGNAVVYLLVVVLLAAIGILAYLLLSSN